MMTMELLHWGKPSTYVQPLNALYLVMLIKPHMFVVCMHQ